MSAARRGGFFSLSLAGLLVGACNDESAPKGAQSAATQLLSIPQAAAAANPMQTELPKRTRLSPNLSVVGSVSFDQDHTALVGPLVEGRVVSLPVSVGAVVKRGQVLAEIESADIGNAQAAFLSARAKSAAAELNLKREQELAERHISSGRERETAQAEAATMGAELNAAKLRLLAFGLEEADVAALDKKMVGGRVPLRSPIDGVVIERQVTLGQAVERAHDAFLIADTRRLWVKLDLYDKDLRFVREGQAVELSTDSLPGERLRANVALIGARIDEQTRTLPVRVEFDNPRNKLKPGMFVTARILGDQKLADGAEVLTVPRKAVQSVDGKSLVFVRSGSGYKKIYIDIGFSDGTDVEVRAGLEGTEEVVTEGAFLLKSELLR